MLLLRSKDLIIIHELRTFIQQFQLILQFENNKLKVIFYIYCGCRNIKQRNVSINFFLIHNITISCKQHIYVYKVTQPLFLTHLQAQVIIPLEQTWQLYVLNLKGFIDMSLFMDSRGICNNTIILSRIIIGSKNASKCTCACNFARRYMI